MQVCRSCTGGADLQQRVAMRRCDVGCIGERACGASSAAEEGQWVWSQQGPWQDLGTGALLALWGRRTAVENGGRACRRLHARYPAHREADGRRESGIGLEDDDGRDVSTQRRVEDLAVDAVDVCATRMDDGGWRGGLAYFVRVREGRAPSLSNAKLRGTFCRRSICAIACGVTTFVTTSGGR